MAPAVRQHPEAVAGTCLEVPTMVERRQPASLTEALNAAAEQLGQLGLAEQTNRAVEKAWGRFVRFAAQGHRIETALAIDLALAREFVEARKSDGTSPSTPAMHWRRSMIRLLFRIWRELGIAEGDPTLDVALPRRSSLLTRPLTDEEVALCLGRSHDARQHPASRGLGARRGWRDDR